MCDSMNPAVPGSRAIIFYGVERLTVRLDGDSTPVNLINSMMLTAGKIALHQDDFVANSKPGHDMTDTGDKTRGSFGMPGQNHA